MIERSKANRVAEQKQASAIMLVRSLWDQADAERVRMAKDGNQSAPDHSSAVLAAWLVAALVDARTVRAMLTQRHLSGGPAAIHSRA